MRCREPSRVRRRASRGITLIEMFIVLVAFAIIMGGAVVPLQRKQEADRVAETRAHMDDIHAAIVGYAMRHRTPGLRYVIETREYAIADTFITPDPDDPLFHLPELRDLGADPMEDRAAVRSYWIPANRPYLPCPDYNNDGMEDRHDPSMTIVQQIMNGHVTDRKPVLRLRAGATPRPGIAGELRLAPDEDQPVRRLADEGTCAHPAGREDDGTTDRGALPWRTLGVLPHDPWGGRYTYRADAVFASALTGIGRRTAIDGYDPRVPLYHFAGPGTPTLRLMPLRRGPVAANPDLRDALTPEPLVPSVVCGPTHLHGNEFSCDPFIRLPDIRVIDPVSGARSSSNEELVAGSVATEPAPLDASNMRPIPFPVDLVAAPGFTEPAAAVHRRGGITDGLPYVLVSHGPNQRLALNHNRLTPEGDVNPCTLTPLGIGSGFRADGALVSPDEIHNSPCPVRPPPSPSFGLTWMRPSHFVDRPRTTRYVLPEGTAPAARIRGLDADFDDIVEWGTRSELLESFAAAGALSPTDLPLLITR